MSIYFEERKLVLPGELLAEGDFLVGDNVFKVGKRLYANRIGLATQEDRRISVIALKGYYEPHPGDIVIGKVVDIGSMNWFLDIRSPYVAILNASDVFGRGFNPQRDSLTKALNLGDIVVAEVAEFDRTRSPLLTTRGEGLGRVSRGRVEAITPSKVPRLVGKKGSMITLLRKETRCDITIGKNGLILVQGRKPEDEIIVRDVIRKVEKEAHVPGLTNRVTELLRSRAKGVG